MKYIVDVYYINRQYYVDNGGPTWIIYSFEKFGHSEGKDVGEGGGGDGDGGG